MATDEERLLIRLEVSQRRIERQLAAINGTVDKRARAMERRFATSSQSMARSLQRVSVAASATFDGIARAATAALAGLGVRELVLYADAWTRISNEIAAAEQISGTAARSTSELNDIASATRSGLEETASLYARLLRVSGQLGVSEADVARATEVLTKSFKAGGAAASEQAAGILQLSQALQSGVLQGDELRSIRENAPLIAQAIADEFGVSIGALKDLGAEGELTADRVFRAILNSQQGIAAAFDATTPTVQDAFTVLRNGAIEFIAAFDDASGSTDALSTSIIDLSEVLRGNTEAAARFGGKIRETFEIIGEVVQAAREQFDFGDTFATVGQDYGDLMMTIMDGFTVLASNAAGTGAAIGQSMLNIVQSVADTSTGLVNTVIEAIEKMLNGIIAGVNAVAEQLDRIPGVDLGSFGDVSLPRFTAAPLGDRGRSPGEAYESARDAVASTIQGARDGMTDIQKRIENAGRRAAAATRPVQGPDRPLPPMQGPNMPPAAALDRTASAAGRAARAVAEITPPLDAANEAAERMGQTLASATSSAIMGAKSAREAFGSLAEELSRMALDSAIQNLFGALAGSATGGNIFSTLGGIFGGARAMGGPVSGGRTYLVGERGPELFTPRSSGGIIPNHAIGGGNSEPVQVVVRVLPSGEFDARVQNTARAVVRVEGPRQIGAALSRARETRALG